MLLNMPQTRGCHQMYLRLFPILHRDRLSGEVQQRPQRGVDAARIQSSRRETWRRFERFRWQNQLWRHARVFPIRRCRNATRGCDAKHVTPRPRTPGVDNNHVLEVWMSE